MSLDLAGGVMKRIKVRHKSVMLPKGVATSTGQTNATNPASLTKLRDSYLDLAKAQSAPTMTAPTKPLKVVPGIDKKFTNMGELLGICPYELRAIMTAEVGEDQTLMLTLLKKFVSAAKLSGMVDLSETHKMLKDAEQLYHNRIADWQNSCDRVKKKNAQTLREVADKEKAFRSAWIEILIDLQTKLERNKDLSTLGEWDRLMIMAIASHGEQYCKITNNSAVMNFNACKGMDAFDISNLQTKAAEIAAEEREMIWQNWLLKASVQDMLSEVWRITEVSTEEESRRLLQLETMIISKSGRLPVYDKWGSINWHQTFYDDDPYTAEYQWNGFDDSHRYKEEIRHIYANYRDAGKKA